MRKIRVVSVSLWSGWNKSPGRVSVDMCGNIIDVLLH